MSILYFVFMSYYVLFCTATDNTIQCCQRLCWCRRGQCNLLPYSIGLSVHTLFRIPPADFISIKFQWIVWYLLFNNDYTNDHNFISGACINWPICRGLLDFSHPFGAASLNSWHTIWTDSSINSWFSSKFHESEEHSMDSRGIIFHATINTTSESIEKYCKSYIICTEEVKSVW